MIHPPDEVSDALRITPDFYAAALEFPRWQPVLADLCAVFGARAAQVSLADPQRQTLLETAMHGIDPALQPDYLALEDHTHDPRIPPVLAMPNRPVTEEMLLPLDRWRTSDFYRRFFLPSGLDTTLASFTEVSGTPLVATIGLMRGPDDPPYGPAEVQRMHLYLPHFRQAMRVAGYRHRTEVEQAALAGLFDALRVGAIVTDRFAEIRYANPAAEALLAGPAGLGIAGGRLVAPGQAGPDLRAAILAATTRPGGPTALQRLPRAPGEPPLLVTVGRLPGPQVPGLGLVLLMDPAQRIAGDSERLQMVYGLTDAEAAVATRIIEGAELAAIAAATGRSVETIRSHLRAVYGKLGIGRRTELVQIARALTPPVTGMTADPGD